MKIKIVDEKSIKTKYSDDNYLDSTKLSKVFFIMFILLTGGYVLIWSIITSNNDYSFESQTHSLEGDNFLLEVTQCIYLSDESGDKIPLASAAVDEVFSHTCDDTDDILTISGFSVDEERKYEGDGSLTTYCNTGSQETSYIRFKVDPHSIVVDSDEDFNIYFYSYIEDYSDTSYLNLYLRIRNLDSGKHSWVVFKIYGYDNSKSMTPTISSKPAESAYYIDYDETVETGIWCLIDIENVRELMVDSGIDIDGISIEIKEIIPVFGNSGKYIIPFTIESEVDDKPFQVPNQSALPNASVYLESCGNAFWIDYISIHTEPITCHGEGWYDEYEHSVNSYIIETEWSIVLIDGYYAVDESGLSSTVIIKIKNFININRISTNPFELSQQGIIEDLSVFMLYSNITDKNPTPVSCEYNGEPAYCISGSDVSNPIPLPYGFSFGNRLEYELYSNYTVFGQQLNNEWSSGTLDEPIYLGNFEIHSKSASIFAIE